MFDESSSDGTSPGAYILSGYNVSNGAVYIIDGVLAPLLDVNASLGSLDGLSFFAGALNSTGLAGQVGAGACPFPQNGTCNVTGVTVWAPTNAAWRMYASSMNTTLQALLTSPQARCLRSFISCVRASCFTRCNMRTYAYFPQ